MGNKRNSQVFTIIICVALIATVTFMKIFLKDKDNSEYTSLTENRAEQTMLDESNSSETEESYESDLDTTIEYKPIDEIDTSLYEENPSSEAVPEGVTDIRVAITNGEVLYDQDFPSGIYKNMKEEFQKFINANFDNPESITDIEILKDTIKEDKENKKLSYDTKVNDGTILSVEIDLYTFDYKFSKK